MLLDAHDTHDTDPIAPIEPANVATVAAPAVVSPPTYLSAAPTETTPTPPRRRASDPSAIGRGRRDRPLAPSPARAAPGSAAKVAVLEERARLEQALWHPLDGVGGDLR
jgi:hypothetical protein